MEPARESAASSEAEPSFEKVVARLNEIVESLEKGDLPLERSLALFEEGVRLSRLGAARLDDAEHRVEQLLASGETRALDARPAQPPTQTSGADPSAKEPR